MSFFQGQYHYIKVGGGQFHAVAVALIHHIKYAVSIDNVALKILLDRYNFHYPNTVNNQASLTAQERIVMLTDSVRPTELVHNLAYVLQQLTVDAIYANPAAHRELFETLRPETSRAYLRQPTTVLPATALRALTTALNLTVTLSFVQQEKKLPRREIYTTSKLPGPKLAVHLQVQDNHYFPKVKNKSLFAYVGHVANGATKPRIREEDLQGNLALHFEKIAAENKRLKSIYTETRNRLLHMVDVSRVDKAKAQAKLQELYIKFLPTNFTASESFKKFLTTQHQPSNQPVNKLWSQGEAAPDLVAKINALSAWVATQEVDEDALFNYLAQKNTQAASLPVARFGN